MINTAIANRITNFIPNSRFFKLKAYIYKKICGYNISPSVRMFSSFNILGIKEIEIGDNTFIGHETLIMGAVNSKVSIGKNVDISSRVSIITGSHKIDLHGERIAGAGISKNVIIKNGAWIGFGSMIMPGVTIGMKSIVASGSIVINDVPDNCMVAGNPAIVKKSLI